ncbi:hypothetical protein NQ314_017783 [Rhamnusium bicolor]|uniref:Uncharacterized protein n=1 Tax=Rhamnusium bicolor TaxID=1586634 RepID=A0AAV8WU03_9CUCU|nr:hypothetical protein NQ314_017783 [Rhamnusium bicolor]
MNLTQYKIYLNNYKLHIVGPKNNHTSDSTLSRNEYNIVQMSVKLGTLTVNEQEEVVPFSDRINIQDLIMKIGDTSGGFNGGLSTILINSK